MPGPIIHIDDLEYDRIQDHGEQFKARVAPVGIHIGARQLSYNVTAVPPGKRAFPFHNHHNNEELFFILSGQGTLRFGRDEYPVRQGDFIACPSGGTEVAHQLVNTGDEELRYLAVSTTIGTDVFQYPDSGKFGFVAGREAGHRLKQAPFSGFYAEDAQLDYWDGE